MDDLELYPGLNPLASTRAAVAALRRGWRRALVYSLVALVIFGLAGYRWVTNVTPVDSERAVELFRAEQEAGSGTSSARQDARAQERTSPRGAKHEVSDRGKRRVAVAPGSGTRTQTQTQQSSAAQAPRSTASDASRERRFEPPREGVYSWATDGYEQVSGARRRFPEETQRILTFDGDGRWTEHHYFSEERESWTSFHWGARGAEVEQQRNEVTFGPVTNRSTIDFDPPMLVGPRGLEVGYRWADSWRGDTSGDYSNEIFEHTTLDIGGRSVEVWGISYRITLRGEQQGSVTAQVWLAPDHGLVVKEHYQQDIESSGARYQAEWTQTLKSLEPQQ